MPPEPERQGLLSETTKDPPTAATTLDDPATSPDQITWASESILLARHSIPLLATYLLHFFYNLNTVLVCSQLSTDELAAASLGITMSNIVGFATFQGLANGLDTLCAQAYGAGNLELVGIHALRFTIFNHVVAIPIAIFWFCSPWILPYIVPSDSLAIAAGIFLRWSMVGIPGYVGFEAGRRFMQAQGNFACGFMVLLACLPLNIGLNWLLVFHLNFRVPGAALSAALTNLARPIILIYCARHLYPATLQCWPRNLEARRLWTNWGPLVRLTTPGAVMAQAETMAFEILNIATSYLGNVALAANTFLAKGENVVWHIPFSLAGVASTRIGQLVGGGHLDAAQMVTRYLGVITIVFGIVGMLSTLALLEGFIHYLSLDHAVRMAMIQSTPYVVIFNFSDCLATTTHGIIRGLGWQWIGGWVAVLCNYLYGVPLSLTLMLGPPKLGVTGLWVGMTASMATVAIIEALLVKFKGWHRLIAEAKSRQER